MDRFYILQALHSKFKIILQNETFVKVVFVLLFILLVYTTWCLRMKLKQL